MVGSMDQHQNNEGADKESRSWRPDLLFAVVMFLSAVGVLVYSLPETGFLASGYGSSTALFFLLFGLFTITMGYQRPGVGHVSFDRVAQISSILVLGPVDAALINGLASLLYPWHRLWKDISPVTVLTASLYNSGMMAMVVLGCGSLYAYLGGPIPPTHIDLRVGGLLLLLMLSMQVFNDVFMAMMMRLRRQDPSTVLNVFSVGLELASAPLAVLVAIIFVRMDLAVFTLLLLAMSLGMYVLKKFAQMRYKLEALVEERTKELRLKTLELERQATHDKLTGLFNRRYADDYLSREIEACKRHDRPFTIALADIDHFKQVNDHHSHAVGDQVLRRIAEILVNRCRKTDVVARYGGEEFLLCFPDTNPEFAEQICSQIRLAIENADWSDLTEESAQQIKITISFGIAEVGNDSRRTSILSDADTRLYRAKRKGRNTVVTHLEPV